MQVFCASQRPVALTGIGENGIARYAFRLAQPHFAVVGLGHAADPCQSSVKRPNTAKGAGDGAGAPWQPDRRPRRGGAVAGWPQFTFACAGACPTLGDTACEKRSAP
jgi:hypothetical protein